EQIAMALADTEVQTISHDGTSGTFTLTFDDQTTDAIAFGASAGDIRTKLSALSNIVQVEVTGAGTTAEPWRVTFLTNRGENVPQLTANTTNLKKSDNIAATATVATVAEGGRLAALLADRNVVAATARLTTLGLDKDSTNGEIAVVLADRVLLAS